MNQFFVTGATGAVGSALIPLLLTEPDTLVHLLLRGESEEELEQKRSRLLAFWGSGSLTPEQRARIRTIRGDVCEPQLGLGKDEYRTLCSEVTHIVHCAGDVRLNKSIDEARRSALGAAREIVALAEAAQQAGRFRKLEFVSTVGVAGRTQGGVAETIPFPAPGFHNTYEQAKFEAEAFIYSKIGSGLPATVHRPSMVVGASETGKIIHFQVFYYLCEFFSGRKTFGVVPDTKNVALDIIPADYVANAIRASSTLPETAGRVFHLCSGPGQAPKIVDLTEELRRIYREHGVPVPRLVKLPLGIFRKLTTVAGRLAPSSRRPLFRSLPFFLDYLVDNQVFDNGETDQFFSGRGLPLPKVRDYLDRIVGVYLESGSKDAQKR